jgi:cytochrome c
MSRFLDAALAGCVPVLVASSAAQAADVAAGEKVFGKCRACHAVGEGAANKVGPHLNGLLGRVAGTVDGFGYSPAMVEAGAEGLVWHEEALTAYLVAPRNYVEGTKMAFAGLKSDDELANVIAYLATFPGSTEGASSESAQRDTEEPADGTEMRPAPQTALASVGIGAGANFQLGRIATEEEMAAWDIDVRPDGLGLPEGQGTVAEGQAIYDENCASCHGDFGEGVGRWPTLAGGQGTLTDDRPQKTVGSFWPYLSTVYDYVRRAQPFGNARSLSDDDVYALTSYILYLNDVVTDEDFELSKENFTAIELPNRNNFIDDDRAQEAHYAAKAEPCMFDCVPGTATIRMHAAVLDVTPDDSEEDDEAPAAGID